MTRTALILGANGRFGRNAAEAFWNAGWRVQLFDRSSGDLMLAAAGMDVIVNAWNPPYTEWASRMPDLTQQVIDAAKSNNATVVLPGNLYVFGPSSPAVLGAHTPHAATNPLGLVRRDMEEAYKSSGVKTILLRAGDFLDTEASGNWFDKIMAPSLKKGVLTYPGKTDVPHAWAYLPDMARAAVALCDKRAELSDFADIPFPGYTLTAQDLAQHCAKTLDRDVKVRKMTWLPIQVAKIVWPMAKHLLEMRYLWKMPHRMDGGLFNSLLPDFTPTPPETALRHALAPFNATPNPPKRGGEALHSAPAA
ncbi:MAG: epimerase [Pelagimonas sp.]|uniref:epimerase n=1 Tax=Pelagimonas sp. TaxID=2073170 RepID=UPI003D6A23C1